MSISLTPEQENFVMSKIKVGKYQSTEEVIELALRLLEEYERAETQWNEEVGEKINAAIAISEHTKPLDGETFVNDILASFDKKRHQEK